MQQKPSEYLQLAAHELKAPLSVIEGYLRLLQSRELGSDIAAYEQMIDRSVIRLEGMRKLVDDVLEMAMIESGTHLRQPQDIELGSIARKAIESFEPEAKKRNISLHLHIAGAVVLSAVAAEIEIIFNNLISNSIKYNRENGQVDVTITSQGKTIAIAVSDTGIGISKEDCQRLFNEFTRIKSDATRNVLGTGLGLAIIKKLAQLYHGHITVDSQPDKGTKFTIVLNRET